MFAEAVIAQAYNDIERHSAEITAPKFWDVSHGGVRFGMLRCSAREVFKELEAALGVYPVVSSVILEPSPAATPLAHTDKPGRTCRELSDFVHDGEASLSLWTVPLDHVCVPDSERRGGIQDEGDEQQEASDGDHTPPSQDHCGVSSSKSSSTTKAIRIALDFKTPKGQFKRRTGTILLRSQNSTTNPCHSGGPGLMGWPVRWDSPKWFPGAQVGLSIPMPPIRVGRGNGSSSHPIEIEDEDEDKDEESRFALLVWKGKMPNPKTTGNAGAEGSIVSMIFKKQDSMQPVQFTEEEKRAFGVGLSEDQVMAYFKLARELFQEKSNLR